MDDVRKQSTKREYYQRLLRVLNHVQTHLDDDLNAGDLARLAHFSKYHFHRIFHGMVGESVAQHVRRLRLERAATEIRRSERDITSVALSSGYEAHESFTRAFRAHFGCSPSEYRGSDEPIEFPPAPSGVHYGPAQAVSSFSPILEDFAMMDVEIRRIEAKRLGALRHTGPYDQIGPLFQQLMQHAFSLSLFGPNTETVGIYFDDPGEVAPEKLRSAACITVGPKVKLPDPFESIETRAGEYAVAMYRGPYEQVHTAYHWLMGQWFPSSGREPADAPCMEVYLNSPQDTKPEDLLTAIHVPLT